MRNIIVLSHLADIDGIGAAALLKMKYRIPASNLFFSGYDLADVKGAYAWLKKHLAKGVTLFITDLGPEGETLPLYERIINEVMKKGGHMFWFDHHPWTDKALKRIAAQCDVAVVGENSEMCATQLVQRFAGLNFRFVKEFTELVHYTDFYLPTSNAKFRKFIEEYKLSIGYYTSRNNKATQDNLRHLASVIASGRFSDAGVHRVAVKFAALNEKRTREMLKSLRWVSKSIVLGFSKQVDSSDACHEMQEKTGADIAVLVKTDHGHCSIRSKKAYTVKLANLLGGGGHPHASGFTVDVKSYNFFARKSDRERFVGVLRRAAQKAGVL